MAARTTARTVSFALFAFAQLLAWPALAREYIVDGDNPLADDSNPGTPQAPWRTVSKAAATAGPGDIVTVRGGIYRESLRPARSGTADAPILYRAAPGQKVVLSGADAPGGWRRCTEMTCPDNPHRAELYYVDLDWAPPALYIDGRPARLAREPNEGWWVPEGGGTDSLVDTAHLSAEPERFVGAGVFFWDTDVTAQSARKVVASAGGTLKLDKPWGYGRSVQAGKDRYYLRGKLAFLDRPGEWAVEPNGSGYRLFLWPPEGKDPSHALVEASRRGRFVIEYANRSHLRFEGLEVRHGAGHGIGSWTDGASDIHVSHCFIHHNLGSGVYLRGAGGVTVRRCRIIHNGNGITGGGCRDVIVEGNEVAYNDYDGVVFSHNSSNITIRANFIHHHARWGHPDNIQFFMGVSNVTVERNVLLDGGQAVMMEGIEKGALRDNLIVGTEAYAVILGHDTVRQFTVDHNTIALCGWGAVSSTRGRHTITNNILCPGYGAALAGRKPDGLDSDHNLFWHGPDPHGTLFAVGGIWTASLDEHRSHNSLDAHSLLADPKFEHAPVAHGIVDPARLPECTRSRLYLRTPAAWFAAGDRVELNFEGKLRTASRVGKDFIEFDPPLRELPEKGGIVVNWGKDGDCRLDFRPAPGSPARGTAADGTDIGARLGLSDLRDADYVLRTLLGARSGAPAGGKATVRPHQD